MNSVYSTGFLCINVQAGLVRGALITANTAKCEQKSLNIQENFNKKKKDSRQNKY